MPDRTRLILAAAGLVVAVSALRPVLPAPADFPELLPTATATIGAVLGAAGLLALRGWLRWRRRDLPRPVLLTTLWGSAALLAVKAADGVAFDVVAAAMNLVSAVTGDPLPINLHIDGAGMALRGSAALTAALLARTALRYQRDTSGACATCGRTGERARRRALTSTVPAYVAAGLALGYAAEKIYWGLGGTLGLNRPGAFGEDVHLWTPGLGDTAALALIGVVIALALARPWVRRLPRWLPVSGAALGSMMLVPVGIMGSVGTISRWDELQNPDPDRPLALEPWVFLIEYPWFLAWGLALAAAALTFYLRTRGRCAACGRS